MINWSGAFKPQNRKKKLWVGEHNPV